MSQRKRRRLNSESIPNRCFGEIIAELDLEISLRRRLANAIESRIAWARILQESLTTGSTGSTTSYKDAALDAISAIETPLDVLFRHETTSIVSTAPAQPSRPSRAPPKQKVPRNTNASFLFIKSGNLEPPYDGNHIQTYLLKCPECFRKAFTSLQGLFNHARISHGLEWGTHDECVRACAVVDPDLDLEAGIEVGLGPNGILPGLRSLFRMAVGAHQIIGPGLGATVELEKTSGEVDTNPSSSYLTRTLGLHKDTPALAHFLGKQAIRRSIKVWRDGDEVVDIDGSGGEEVRGIEGSRTLSIQDAAQGSPHRIWRMRLNHRNNFEPGTVHDAGHSTVEESTPVTLTNTTIAPFVSRDNQSSLSSAKENMHGILGSRFHFATRVIIVDSSFWIPTERREGSNLHHTHKWMISVDAPSYSNNITTVLKRLTVSPASHPNSSSLTTTKPPFVTVGTAHEPFLARVDLHFTEARGPNGELAEQLVTLEHWVELDLFSSSSPVLGDEQVVDIELDKGTIFLPIQKGYTPIGARALWFQTSEASQAQDSVSYAQQLQVCTIMLKGIVGKFPMTLEDFKGGRQDVTQVPYKLVPTSQFNNLVPGRRKAIEWSRARAIQEAYIREAEGPRFTDLSPIPLTTADVYNWLTEDGHFIRSADIVRPEIEQKQLSVNRDHVEVWCSTCGQDLGAHVQRSLVKSEVDNHHSLLKTEVKPEGDLLDTSVPCNLAARTTRMPMVNILDRVRPYSGTGGCCLPHDLQLLPNVVLQPSDLTATNNPKFTLAVQKMVRVLKLPAFASPAPTTEALFPDKNQVETCLAPYATIALAAQQFLKVLVGNGVVAARMEKEASAKSLTKKRGNSAETVPITSLLTPSHILSSVIAQGQLVNPRGIVNMAIYECLVRFGVPITSKEVPTVGEGTQSQVAEPPTAILIKVEQL